ncbi:hypothetical protein C0991_008203 [Blastosporella zonata]|nr:hypothetical protein C0991_008203 [Blastosporella zonata]
MFSDLITTLLNEISEVSAAELLPFVQAFHSYQVSRPMLHHDLMQTVCQGPGANSEKSQRMIAAIKATVRPILKS